MIKRFVFLLLCFGLVTLWGCQNRPGITEARVAELCRHLPDVDSLGLSEGWLTEDYYYTLEAMIALPDSTEVLHEWEFWFVAADGSIIARDSCTVLSVHRTGFGSARAAILIQPEDSCYETEEHILYLEKVRGVWLISDFDDTKEHAINRLTNES